MQKLKSQDQLNKSRSLENNVEDTPQTYKKNVSFSDAVAHYMFPTLALPG